MKDVRIEIRMNFSVKAEIIDAVTLPLERAPFGNISMRPGVRDSFLRGCGDDAARVPELEIHGFFAASCRECPFKPVLDLAKRKSGKCTFIADAKTLNAARVC